MDFFIPLTVLIMIIGGSVAAKSLTLFLIAFLGYTVWAFTLFSRGMTPGKKIMGIQVVKEDGRPADFFTMLIRETFGKLISGLVFGLGWIWILIDKERQGWHDKLVSTFVVQPLQVAVPVTSRPTAANPVSAHLVPARAADPPRVVSRFCGFCGTRGVQGAACASCGAMVE